MVPVNGEHVWERSRQYVPNKRVSTLRLGRWRKMRRSNRRRKSHVAYWWGPVLLGTLVVAGLLAVAWRLPHGEPRVWPEPASPSLRVIAVPEATLLRLQRAENMRRQATALSDEEVGISLEPVLPEPAARVPQTVVPVAHRSSAARKIDTSPAAYLPQMHEQQQVRTTGNGIKWTLDAKLKACGFGVAFPLVSAEGAPDEVRFQVTLNDAGSVIEVLRYAPIGPETPWLKTVREALFTGHGKTAGRGEIRIYRK